MASFSPSQRPLACAHKNASRCVLSIPGCCACSDHRPHTQNYYVYVDGVGDVPQGTRWTYYCDHCKAFWECQIRRAGISASLSRIPDFPRSSALDGPRSPRRTIASAFSQMEHYLSSPTRGHRPLLGLSRVSREETQPSSHNLEDRLQRHPSLFTGRARGTTVSPPSSPDMPEEPSTQGANSRRIQRPQILSINRVGDAAEIPPSPVSPGEPPTIQIDTIRRQQQRLQSLRNAAPERQYSSTSSEGSMDAQASTTGAVDDQEMPVESRNLLSFVESRAHITNLGNELDRIHARMVRGRHETERNNHWGIPRSQVLIRPVPPRGSQAPTRPSRREVSSILDETDRTWSSVASVTSATTDNSNVSLEVQASRTPDRVLPQPILDSQPQSEQSTQTNSPLQSDRVQPIWSLANSVQDIETELAHLSEGAARRSAELASLSQQLEEQTREYAARAQRASAEQGEGYDHSDILGRASEGLRRLRELRERRERGEQQEQIRRVWGNPEDEDYISPVTALFQRSWEAHSRRQQAEQEGRRLSPTSVWFPDSDALVPEPVRAPIDASVTLPDTGLHGTAINLATATDEAAAILQTFRGSLEGETISLDQQDLINRAVDGMLHIQREVRSRTRINNRHSRRSRGGRTTWEPPKGLDDDESRPPPLEAEAMVMDCECKICFGQIADTVLLPCSHLVLCGWCADQMGVRKLSEFSPRTVQCPICRANVVDRIKVFRG